MNGISKQEIINKLLEYSWRAFGNTAPNPPVAALLVKNGGLLGTAHTQPNRGPHAEAQLLENLARERGAEYLAGGDLYVTLEPCAHFGKNPPCAPLAGRFKLNRVHYVFADPNPLVDGRGHLRIQADGVSVEQQVAWQKELLAPLEAFFHATRTGRARFWLKSAQTLDGYMTDKAGRSQWLTGNASRRVVQRLRLKADAILAGAGTLLADRPRLNVRGELGLDKGELWQPHFNKEVGRMDQPAWAPLWAPTGPETAGGENWSAFAGHEQSPARFFLLERWPTSMRSLAHALEPALGSSPLLIKSGADGKKGPHRPGFASEPVVLLLPPDAPQVRYQEVATELEQATGQNWKFVTGWRELSDGANGIMAWPARPESVPGVEGPVVGARELAGWFYSQGFLSVMVEGGPGLFRRLLPELDSGSWWFRFQAPRILGGGKTGFGSGPGFDGHELEIAPWLERHGWCFLKNEKHPGVKNPGEETGAAEGPRAGADTLEVWRVGPDSRKG